ncbi:SDR family NAD(P)-dependent oxidoreductase [Actinomadura sp. HBU206391]|uniref:SDR family NAD(P)-dependent oxidoreductase n=1 Tax=Actinomadura sp. HBU206391 TaxID=2731692 RepID=UPI00164F8827|nr:SDR family NAD(P)-dependent oxidoreductase [Actinomadura sp. HBU206391]MBC6457288.1 SDR family NAD(P)-dependent oxidoreductase [Actinomadura sp. HBU206391]
MTAQRIALITGANQGIGYALVEGLAARWSPQDLVLLTGRDPARVTDATARAAAAATTVARVEGAQLDVTDTGAIARMAAELGERYGGIDVVVSNAIARMTPDLPQEEQADEFIDVANGATHAMLRSFGPTVRPGGRLIVVASSLGTLGNLDERLHPLLENASLEAVESLVESWRTAVHAGTAQDLGWPKWINVPSKVAQVAAVRAVARERRGTDLPDGTLVAAVCPGLVDTATSRPWFADFSRARTPAQAAAPLLDFILAEPIDPATYGELVRDGKVLPWHSGSPADPNVTPANR